MSFMAIDDDVKTLDICSDLVDDLMMNLNKKMYIITNYSMILMISIRIMKNSF